MSPEVVVIVGSVGAVALVVWIVAYDIWWHRQYARKVQAEQERHLR